MWTTATVFVAAVGGLIAGISTAVRLVWDARDRTALRRRLADDEEPAGLQTYTEAEMRAVIEELEDGSTLIVRRRHVSMAMPLGLSLLSIGAVILFLATSR